MTAEDHHMLLNFYHHFGTTILPTIPLKQASLPERVASRSECNQLGTPPSSENGILILFRASLGRNLGKSQVFLHEKFPLIQPLAESVTSSKLTLRKFGEAHRVPMHSVDLHILPCLRVWSVLRHTHL